MPEPLIYISKDHHITSQRFLSIRKTAFQHLAKAPIADVFVTIGPEKRAFAMALVLVVHAFVSVACLGKALAAEAEAARENKRPSSALSLEKRTPVCCSSPLEDAVHPIALVAVACVRQVHAIAMALLLFVGLAIVLSTGRVLDHDRTAAILGLLHAE